MDKTHQRWYLAMPICLIGTACDDAQTLEECFSMAQTEIDLYNEGQKTDLTKDDIKAVKRWIRDYSK